jgi:hypothetical protein
MIRGPFTTRHYPNLPSGQQPVQRLADEFNAAEREWERKHPANPKRKSRRKMRKTGAAVGPGPRSAVRQTIGFGRP